VVDVDLIIPSAIDPGRAQQTRPCRSRSFVRRALHLDRHGLVDGKRDDQGGSIRGSAFDPFAWLCQSHAGVRHAWLVLLHFGQGRDLKIDIGEPTAIQQGAGIHRLILPVKMLATN
jgi:hypothetical protein